MLSRSTWTIRSRVASASLASSSSPFLLVQAMCAHSGKQMLLLRWIVQHRNFNRQDLWRTPNGRALDSGMPLAVFYCYSAVPLGVNASSTSEPTTV